MQVYWYAWNEDDCDGDGFTECQGDCDDSRADVYPGARQRCDGRNHDCLDPRWPALTGLYEDGDGDGFTECQGDCDDSLATVGPQAVQICGDGINNLCGPGWPSLFWTNEWDDDGDGWTECGGDCDDGNAALYPGAGIDIPGDLVDQDCLDGPSCDPLAPWASHGDYVSCVDTKCAELKKAGLLTGKECDSIVTAAAQSSWGSP